MNGEVLAAAAWVELSEASPDGSCGIFHQPGKGHNLWRLTGGR